MLAEYSVLQKDWKGRLANLIQSANDEIIISSPYVTLDGTKFIVENLSQNITKTGTFLFVTNLSPINIYQKSTDPNAFTSLTSAFQKIKIQHLPRLHAKVYIVDSKRAIVTSGNLTAGGLKLNYEYGVEINNEEAVSAIKDDISEYANLGVEVTKEKLASYCKISDEIKIEYSKVIETQRRQVKEKFNQLVREAEYSLVELQLKKGAVHTVFAETILYLLRKNGGLTTEEIHQQIQNIHPDLCDENLFSVISGVKRGRKWKHQVRTSQQNLKKVGKVKFQNGMWLLS